MRQFSEREKAELLRVATEALPIAFEGTEQGMQEALVENARRGL